MGSEEEMTRHLCYSKAVKVDVNKRLDRFFKTKGEQKMTKDWIFDKVMKPKKPRC